MAGHSTYRSTRLSCSELGCFSKFEDWDDYFRKGKGSGHSESQDPIEAIGQQGPLSFLWSFETVDETVVPLYVHLGRFLHHLLPDKNAFYDQCKGRLGSLSAVDELATPSRNASLSKCAFDSCGP
uniref:Uncharacterized protein n=1 Tax=Steinernema glaseri TaxID=37863 RepID=A0A1I8AE87_9BILA